MDTLDRHIINHLQRGFPVCSHPFARVARALETDEETLITRLQAMLDDGRLTRFGPLYNAERLGGELSLCALQVPGDRFDAVCAVVNSFDEVAHNYERDHVLNMWFVVAADSIKAKAAVLEAIETQTGLHVLDMPKEREYYVGLYLEV